jgi:PAS domain S-box-containing protein
MSQFRPPVQDGFPEGARNQPFVASLMDLLGQGQLESALRESALVQRALFEGAGDHVLVLEIQPGGVPLIVDMNEAALRAHGYSRAELLGQPITVLEPDMGPELGMERERILLEEPGSPFRGRHRRKDGSYFDVEIRAHQLSVNGRQFSVAIERDITDRLEAERALRESEQRLREAQALARIGHWEHHHQEGWTHWSSELYRIHGREPGTSPPSFEAYLSTIHPEDREAVKDAYEGLFRGEGDGRTLEFRVVLPGGAVSHFRSHCKTQFGPGGEPIRTFGTDQDITERVRESEARQALESQLQHLQRMESVGRLAGGVAHDMNNVLAAILAVATQLQQEGGEAEASAALILKACLRGREMVRNLLDFSRREAHRREVVDIHELLQSEVKLLACTTLGKVAISLDLQARQALVLGEASALSNALMNLCLNAIDAMPGGGELRLRTRNGEPGALEILVEDTGPGMPPDILNHAIEPFFTSKPKGKGTGLGLSIAYGIIKSHGGNLELESAPGAGTTVRIALPVSSMDEDSSRLLTAEPARPKALQVLFVDDDPLVRDTAPLMIRVGGHQVRVASSGRGALALLEAGLQVDVVVLDFNMPGMDGREVLDAIRVLRPLLPVIITSGFVDQESMVGLLKWENLQVMEKPYSLPEIQAAFARI